MMIWSLNYLIFWLFINFWYHLLNFKYLTYLFINIFRNLFLSNNFSSLYWFCMIWYSKLSLYLLSCKYLLFCLNRHLLYDLNWSFLLDLHFYNIYFLIIFNNLLNNLWRYSIWSLYNNWNFNYLTFTILVWNLFSIWNSLL